MLGERALVEFPSRRACIERVMEEISFEIRDLTWIAASLRACIRLTVQPETHALVLENDPYYKNLQQDSLFGYGQVCAHLLFSWTKALGEQRFFGHFDILTPRSQTLFSLILPVDDTGHTDCNKMCVYVRVAV